jgi:hypothetical protein
MNDERIESKIQLTFLTGAFHLSSIHHFKYTRAGSAACPEPGRREGEPTVILMYLFGINPSNFDL